MLAASCASLCDSVLVETASQVATRLVTFTLTLLTARLLTVEAYGVRLPWSDFGELKIAAWVSLRAELSDMCGVAAGFRSVSPDQHYRIAPQPRGLSQRLPASQKGESILLQQPASLLALPALANPLAESLP